MKSLAVVNEPDEIWTYAKVCKYLKRSRGTVRNLINGRYPEVPRLECIRLGNSYIFEKSVVVAWLKAARRSHGPTTN